MVVSMTFWRSMELVAAQRNSLVMRGWAVNRPSPESCALLVAVMGPGDWSKGTAEHHLYTSPV